MPSGANAPSGSECECGCGQAVGLAYHTNAAKGWIKGQPLRFVRGHGVKECYRCGCMLSRLAFPKRPSGHRGRTCRECLDAIELVGRAESLRRYRESGKAKAAGDRWRARNQDYVRARTRRRRAVMAGAEHEPYSFDAIYVRDAGRCQLCGEPVEEWGNVRMGATMDHVVPLSQGGGDTPDNVRLAHRSCNSGRGAGRVEG